jgi:hypothetical protein
MIKKNTVYLTLTIRSAKPKTYSTPQDIWRQISFYFLISYLRNSLVQSNSFIDNVDQ